MNSQTLLKEYQRVEIHVRQEKAHMNGGGMPINVMNTIKKVR